MPVEFLTDEEAAAYGRYGERLSRPVLEKVFFLDDDDRALIGRRRGPHMMLGFALQLVTVRYLGTFLADPMDVPTGGVDYVAGQLGVADPSCVKRYTERRSTRFEHAEEIKRAYGLRDFAAAEAELAAWVDARAWATGDGPKVIFTDAVAWLRERWVLLPGVNTLARLVARVREEATSRLQETLAGLLTGQQRRLLDLLLEVPDGARVSDLERWRRAPLKQSGPGMIKALDRVAEIAGLGLAGLDVDAVVPHRRVVELARYGMAAKAAQLRRHGDARRLATLLAAVTYLEAKAVDDALELLDLLVTAELVGRAERQADKQRARRHPKLARAAATVGVAVEVLLEARGWGEHVTLAEVWEAIEAVVPRAELAAAVSTITGLVPPPDADDDGDWRAQLARRIVTVSGFIKMLTEVIEFGCNADGAEALAAMRELPALLGRRRKLAAADVRTGLVTGSWQRLVFGSPPRPDGRVHKNAYVFCVLTEFHRRLRRRDIYAEASSRWRDPRAQLLAGPAWQAAKDPVLTALSLPEDPGPSLADQARLLDAAYRETAGRIADGGTGVTVDRDGRLHVAALKAIPEPPSLVDLRTRTTAMLPRVDLPEVILEVMCWEPGFTAAFTSITGGRARLADLGTSIAACLAAHAMNIGFTPVISPGVPALERDRLAHVDHTYLCAENYAAANAYLIEAQARIPLAAEWGGGHVAAVDGMRFVVAVPSVYARPSRKFFGPRRGITWLNMINDQAAGLGYKVVAGTPRDTLHFLDVVFSQDGGQRPDILVTDAGSYADLTFGLVHLLGMSYRPALADLPDHRMWRFDPAADYGSLNTAARGRLDPARIIRHWPDMLRVAGSIYTGSVRAYDVVRALQRDGHPTPLGEAISCWGRIPKSWHMLALLGDESYRRDIKGIRNLQEGRHGLGGKIFHGRKGQIYQRYYPGMEDQLGALGLVLNCVVLWNTTYLNAALDQLRVQGYPVRGDDAARLSPFVTRHLNVHGHYSFHLPDLGGRRRPLRDPGAEDDLEE